MALKIFFVGNRKYVFEEIYKNKLEIVSVFTPRGSYLSKYLAKNQIPFKILSSKEKLNKSIIKNDFDVLVSNGCPFILPVSALIKPHQKFVNIHPSLLPDLRGRNPINGAILFNKTAGATCHLMNDGIDTGRIISQVKVGKLRNIRLNFAYQLCFKAEAEAFCIALKKNFIPMQKQIKSKSNVYYTRKDDDMIISFKEKLTDIVRKVKAFGIDGQCARFYLKNEIIKVLDANVINNEFLQRQIGNYQHKEIVFSDNFSMVFRYENVYIEFIFKDKSMKNIVEGKILS